MSSVFIIVMFFRQISYLVGSILYIPVPHVEHTPLIAGRPFFILTLVAFFISRFALHLTQYPVSAN